MTPSVSPEDHMVARKISGNQAILISVVGFCRFCVSKGDFSKAFETEKESCSTLFTNPGCDRAAKIAQKGIHPV